jgi:restriction system protein
VIDDLFVIAAKLPWKVSAGLAVVSFLVFHGLAGVEIDAATSTKDIGASAAKTMFQTVAKLAQFIVPLVFVGGAIASFMAKARRTELVDSIAASNAPDSLNEMTWREFESLVEEAYRLRGYSVRRIGGDGPDGGVDLVLDRGTEKVLVQCKQWRAMKVGVSTIREMYGVMAAKGAASGIVVTSGRFTAEAVEFASGRNIKLVEGDELRRMIREAKGAHGATKVRTAESTPIGASATGCPQCGSAMIKRVAKRGASAGQSFYGCSRYPACRGTRPAT